MSTTENNQSISPDMLAMMQQMHAAGTAVIQPSPMPAAGTIEMPTMPNFGGVAPVAMPEVAQASVAPVAMPTVQQEVAIQAPVAIPAVQQEVTIPAPSAATGTPLNLANGLDLEQVMTPEAEVKLAKAEVEAKPIIINGLQSIGNCKVSVWSTLITILDFIAKGTSNNDIISIDQGTIDTHREGIFIHCDMRTILGNISLNLTSPDSSVKLLKLIKGGELIQIFKEDSTNSYVFCNIQDGKVFTKVKTTYSHESADGFGKAPALGNPVFQKEIPQAEKEIIKTIIAGKAAISSDEPYRFGFSKIDNTLVSIGVGKNFTHFFQDSTIEVNEYRTYNPFPVPNMESCIIRFFTKTDDNSFWIQTVSNISVSSIVCTEKVELIDSTIEDFDFN